MLYIVPTPIGNISDITVRAIEVLKDCDFIIAENPSHTAKLLSLLELPKTEMVQFAEYNERIVLPKIVERLKSEKGCLVSDAGTPGISDPGFRIVRACREESIDVIALPGASAAITALSASGLPTDKFLFVGFLQKTEPKVISVLNEAKNTNSTLIAYESPQRILKTVTIIKESFPEATLVVARELTKVHEEYIRGDADAVIAQLNDKPVIKGEIVLLVSFK